MQRAQQRAAARALGTVSGEENPAGFIGLHFEVDGEVFDRQEAARILRPLGQFQARLREDVAQAGVFPFARVVEAVEIEVPDAQVFATGCRDFMGLDHGVGGTLDASRHAEGAQQVPHERRLACAQIAVQRDECIAHGGARGQRFRGGLRVLFRAPGHGFYNGRVVNVDSTQLVARMQAWARELGFSQIGIAGVDLSSAEPGLLQWLDNGFHGEMAYMETHGLKRARPAELVPGTVSVITARMDYLPRDTPAQWQDKELSRLNDAAEAVISIYARGRDYHKVLRNRLQKLSDRIGEELGPFGHRVFTDSAPVLEAELAARSGQGWRGKHTLLLNREAGSMFFLGEIYVDMALEPSEPVAPHCGSCSACIDVCPTQAIIAPHRLDARRCISYLTIEHAGPIPLELRPLIGNRIYGCDDCQLICPWNKFAQRSTLPDFDERHGLGHAQLVDLMAWTEDQFLHYTEGSPIRRIGHERWQRNVAVAMGNMWRESGDVSLRDGLAVHRAHSSMLVREHVLWGLAQR